MKLSTRIAFAALVVWPVWNSTSLLAAPSNAGSMPRIVTTKETPRVTRDNFVSLSWDLVPGHFNVQGNILSHSDYAGGGGGGFGVGGGFSQGPMPIVPDTEGISNNQLNLLIERINSSRFTSMAGSNCQSRGIFASQEEVAVLTISDKKNQDQKFILRSVGKNYNDLKAFWIKFIEMKFPSRFNFNPVPPKANPTNP